MLTFIEMRVMLNCSHIIFILKSSQFTQLQVCAPIVIVAVNKIKWRRNKCKEKKNKVSFCIVTTNECIKCMSMRNNDESSSKDIWNLGSSSFPVLQLTVFCRCGEIYSTVQNEALAKITGRLLRKIVILLQTACSKT